MINLRKNYTYAYLPITIVTDIRILLEVGTYFSKFCKDL